MTSHILEGREAISLEHCLRGDFFGQRSPNSDTRALHSSPRDNKALTPRKPTQPAAKTTGSGPPRSAGKAIIVTTRSGISSF